jgi:hypothetical protein
VRRGEVSLADTVQDQLIGATGFRCTTD